MAHVVDWGKPKVEFGLVGINGQAPTSWTVMPVQKEDSVQLTTEKGEVKELWGEGHELVARKVSKSTYKLEMEVFLDRAAARPIVDVDGVVSGIYSARLTPEDETLTGFKFNACTVEVEDLWSSAEGSKVKYTFTAIKPATGNMFETYKKA